MFVQPTFQTPWYPKNRPTVTRTDSVTLALQQMTVCRDIHTEVHYQEPSAVPASNPLVRANNLMRTMLNEERRPALNFGVG